MISLIIIDDEITIRKGLSLKFDWSNYGIELAGEAANGKDGLSLARMVHPDIIITDIKMPLMSGLDMAKIISEELPETKIIILTGYSDFNYAKKALSLKAVDYLLKPVNFNELTSIITEISGQINKQISNKEKRKTEEAFLSQALPYLRTRFLAELANNKISYDEFFIKAKELGIPVIGSQFSVGLIQFDDLMINLELSSLFQRNSYDLIIQKTIQSQLNNNTLFCIAYFDSNLFLLLNTNDCEGVVQKFWNILSNSIFEQLKSAVTIGVSKSFNNAANIGKAIHEASAALDLRMRPESSRVITFQGKLTQIIPILSISNNEEKKLTELLHRGNKADIDSFIDKIIDYYILSSSLIPKRGREQFCLSLIRLSVREGIQSGLSLEDLFGENRNLYEELSKQKTCEALHSWMKNLFNLMANSFREKESSVPPSIITVSIAYAKENYSSSLSVSALAERMKVTANYFSRLFKQWTGVNFVEWLNSYRIEEAKKQLVQEPDKKIYEIASDTGFNDYKYFAYIFKKNVGYTPQCYRDLNIECEINKIKGE